MTADNASSNNVQAAVLFTLENTFDIANHVRCFNHTIQLSGKALIKPFNAGMGKTDGSPENSHDDMPSIEDFEYDDDMETVHDAVSGDPDVFDIRNDKDDGELEDEEPSREEQLHLLDDTSTVRETVTKV
jgi:hypothetical protein